MRLREHEAIQDGKLDMFRADPRKLVVQDNYNVRDLTTPEAVEKLRELAASIAEIGVTDPLMVRFDGQRIVVVQGHRRLAATLMAIEGGADIKSVPIYQEARSANDATRDLDLIISNAGEPLTQLEKATIVGRLVAHGWSHTDIAKKCGWKSTNTVTGLLDMLALPEAVKTQVRDKEVSPSLAVKIMKEQPEHVAELIKANVEENKRLGVGAKMKHKATPKTINRDRPKPAKPPSPSDGIAADTRSAAAIEPAPAAAETHTDAPLPSGSDTTTASPPLSGAGATAARELAPPVIPVPPTVRLDLLPVLIELTKQSKRVLEANRSDECPGGYWTPELVDAVRVAERVIGLCGNGHDPFARLDAAVEETMALVEGEHV